MNNFLFLMKQHFFNILHFIHEIPFNIRLKYLIWKYNGGQNIPAHELKKMIVVNDAEEELHNVITLLKVISDICGKLKIKYDETRVYHILGCYIRNESLCIDHSNAAFALLQSKSKRKDAFRLMVAENDVKLNLLKFNMTPDEINNFEKWLKSE